MKNGSKIPGILMIVVAVVLFCVQETALAVIFGIVAILMLTSKPKAAATTSAPAPKRTSAPAPRSGVDSYSYRGSVDSYFEEVLRDTFPAYTVRSNVMLAPASEPISFGLYRDGELKVAIMLCYKDQWNTKDIRETFRACDRSRIPCLRFMREFRNDKTYVVNRISKALRSM